jgi:hypothetical protein
MTDNYELPKRKLNPANKINPYKILVLLLYGTYDFVKWDCDLCTGRTNQLARLIRKPTHRVRDYLRWLADRGYIQDLQLDWGKFKFKQPTPKNLMYLEEFRPSCTCDHTQRVEFTLEGENQEAEDEKPSDPWFTTLQ